MEKNYDWLKPGWPLAAIFIILSYALYGHTLHFPFFVFDDGSYILANEKVRSLSLGSFFHFWINSKIPVPYNLWQIAFAFFGENPAGYRFMNILFHGLTSFMVFKVLYNLSTDENRSRFNTVIFGASIFFLIHPMNVESVVWISSLNGILSLFFALLSYDYYSKILNTSDKESLKPIILSIVFYTLSLLSKPVSAVFPVIFILTDFFILKRNIKEKWWLFVYYFSLTFALSLLHVEGIEDVEFNQINLFEKLFVTGNAIVFYIKQVVLPFKLFVVYPDSIFDVLKGLGTNKKFMIPIFNISILCFIVALWTKKEYRKVTSGILIFLALIIPVSGIIPFEFQKMSYVADRYAYHPIFGISFFLVFIGYEVMKRMPNIEKVVKYGCLAFLILLSIKNFSYSAKWAKNSSVLSKSYENAKENSYLGIAYANTKTQEYQLDDAMDILNTIYKSNPQFNETLSSIIETFSFRCDPHRTQKILEMVENSKSPLPIETLLAKANLHISLGQLDKAYMILLYIKSSHLNLSDEATSLLEDVNRELYFTETKSYFNIGYLNYKRYEYKKALEFFEKGLAISTDEHDIANFNTFIMQTKELMNESEN